MENCVFCKIVKKDILAEIVYEDDKIIAFLDIKPVNPGHTLIIPKEHHKMMGETPDEIISDMFVKAKKIMRTIRKVTGADYVAVSVVGLDVPHFHIHLVPRYLNDGLANFWPSKTYKENEAGKIAQKIRSFLK